ncbi:alpha/beta hydrolase [Halobacillus shinanisalinarum]|uniref:Alpha/beta hydrolase n=1 Tax=Halobacillus shinanisalinarum TaxID=2932258 RepID=A0ABY4GTU5_9BACI|nr:alpha/beta hydrolase [Halobacillus shinanisalinarum]UOQ91571.1 alpha/beta hydrolase [Halobacillus shinanisalinarum]
MVLDRQVKVLLQQIEAAGAPPLESLPPVYARQAFQELEGNSEEPPEPVAKAENRSISGLSGDINVRAYTPSGEGPHPALVFYHGGGWVIGNLDTHDNVCRALTNLANCVVISIDYRLAPEHKFPAAVDDCYAAAQWIIEHPSEFNIDASKVAVGGDSAGGNLSAVICHLAKERGTFNLAHQLLFYPATDFTAETESMRENAEGYFLTKGSMFYFRDHYLRTPEDAANPLASPFLIDDLSGLPPATVITAEYDPLRDEGEAYANRLKEAGVPVTLKRYDGMIHGFVSMADKLDQGKRALEQAGHLLRSAFDK